MPKPNILAISGSLRKDSYNTAILRTLATHLTDKAAITVHSLDGIPVYNEDLDQARHSAVDALRAALKACDGMIISSPEYNHGAPGALFNALDWASRPYGNSAFKGKPVLVISASPASTGGARAHTHLYPALIANECRLVGGAQICVADAGNRIQNGVLTDEATLKFISSAVDRLLEDIAD